VADLSIRSGRAAKMPAAARSTVPACSLLQRRRLSLVPQKLRLCQRDVALFFAVVVRCRIH
jgi:hypothetical protein